MDKELQFLRNEVSYTETTVENLHKKDHLFYLQLGGLIVLSIMQSLLAFECVRKELFPL